MKKKLRKSTWIPLVFVLYSIAVYAYVLPQTTASMPTICMTIGLNVVVIIALWWLYRKKEKMAEERERDLRRANESRNADTKSIE